MVLVVYMVEDFKERAQYVFYHQENLDPVKINYVVLFHRVVPLDPNCMFYM